MRPKHLPRLWCALQGLLPIEAGRRRHRAPGAAWRSEAVSPWSPGFGAVAGRAQLVLRRRRAVGTLARMALHESKIEIPPAAVGAVDDLLLEHGLENWSVLEDVILKRAWIVGICAGEAEALSQWNHLAALLALGEIKPISVPVVRLLGDSDWRDSYKAHFHAWHFGRLHWVPVWERAIFSVPPGDAVLWLDPGLAFGTGNHETTRLCVERLVALAGGESGPRSPEQSRVIDAGCGSGILALSAALLGFGTVSGFDNDAEAVRVSEENAAANGLAGRVRFSVADLVGGLSGCQAEVVLANIQADVLMRFAPNLVAAVAPGGALVLSGILAGENAQVRAAFGALTPAWRLEWRVMGEWSDVMLVRPK